MPGLSSARSSRAGLSSRGVTLQVVIAAPSYSLGSLRAVEDHPFPIDPGGEPCRRARLEPDGVCHRRRALLPAVGHPRHGKDLVIAGIELGHGCEGVALTLCWNWGAVDEQRNGRLWWAAGTGSRERLLPGPDIPAEEIERDWRGKGTPGDWELPDLPSLRGRTGPSIRRPPVPRLGVGQQRVTGSDLPGTRSDGAGRERADRRIPLFARSVTAAANPSSRPRSTRASGRAEARRRRPGPAAW